MAAGDATPVQITHVFVLHYTNYVHAILIPVIVLLLIGVY